jgi:hypothetical protein
MAQLVGKRLPSNCRYTVPTTNAIFPEHLEDERAGRFLYMREKLFFNAAYSRKTTSVYWDMFCCRKTRLATHFASSHELLFPSASQMAAS